MSEAEVMDLMLSSRSRTEWDANCDKVKRAFDGYYPEFWFGAVVKSGLMSLTVAGFDR